LVGQTPKAQTVESTPALAPGPAADRPGAERAHASILFTAFEPSGDALAAPVIAELRQRVPNLHIYAWGGPKMQEAGATILENTCEDGAMGLSAISRAMRVRREIRKIRRWSKQYRVLAHVAVDSPAANFPICKIFRNAGARVIHLVAPQIWAWAGWRIRKLRRLTDLVLCLLPFEEQWFNDRGVPAKFIGHPVMNRPIDEVALREQMQGLPQGAPRVVILPGSRSQEVSANIRLLAAVFAELQSRHTGMSGIIVAANSDLARIVRRKVKTFPIGLHMITGQVDAAIAWCDLALAVSGTVTLDITRQRKPMVGVYRTGLLSWLGAKFILRTPFVLLPNLIAEREIVPEFAPYIGGPMPIIKAASKYLLDSKNAANQSEELARVCLRYSNKKPGEEAARLIIKVIRDGSADAPARGATVAVPSPRPVAK
jgi:lipid-A-disaccharide synthase